MLGGHVFHGLTLQVVPLVARRHALQIARGAGVQAQRHLERLALEQVRVCSQDVLEDAALERAEHGTEQVGVQRCQLLQRRVHALGRACACARATCGRCSVRRTVGARTALRRLAPFGFAAVAAAPARAVLAPLGRAGFGQRSRFRGRHSDRSSLGRHRHCLGSGRRYRRDGCGLGLFLCGHGVGHGSAVRGQMRGDKTLDHASLGPAGTEWA